MNIDQMIQEVDVLEGRLGHEGLIDGQGHHVLQLAKASLQSYKKRPADQWNVSIEPHEPLAFRETKPKHVKHRMKVDLFGLLSQPENGIPTGKHSIVIRVWCLKKNVWFDPRLDASELAQDIATGSGRRVMLRFRFDYALPGADEPWFHLQIGGQQEPDEFYRMPDNLGTPRFLHHPMNLVMACEFVVRHFYPEAYDAFSKEPNLRGVLRKAEAAYLAPFLDRVRSYQPDSDVSFLSHMWRLS